MRVKDIMFTEEWTCEHADLYSAPVLAHDTLFDGNHTSRHRKRPRVVAAQLALNFTAEHLSAFLTLRDDQAAMFLLFNLRTKMGVKNGKDSRVCVCSPGQVPGTASVSGARRSSPADCWDKECQVVFQLLGHL